MATKRNIKAKDQVQVQTERDERRTRRAEALRDVTQALPSILEASAKVIDSVAAAQRAHVEGCGSRYAEVVLAEHASGVSFLNRLLTLAEETGIVEAVAGAVKAACAASEAESREDTRRADSIKFEPSVVKAFAPEPAPEPAPRNDNR